MNETKQCRRCKKIKNISEFFLRNAADDKLDSYCKICRRWYRNGGRDPRVKNLKSITLPLLCKFCNIVLTPQSRNETCKKCYSKIKKEKVKLLRITGDFRIKIDKKTCKKCDKNKNINLFSLSPLCLDGHHGICKKCVNKQKRNDKTRANERENYLLNRDKKLARRRELYKRPFARLRSLVSKSIHHQLFKSKSKKNASVMKYLKYSMEELKQYLESKFESWMTWNNHGKYNANYDTWQIDHIIPQAKLPYTSMEDDNFNKCWALENLRPLKAKDNFIKATKMLHELEDE